MIKWGLMGFATAWAVACCGPAYSQNYSTDLYDIAETGDREGCWLGGDWEVGDRSPVNLEIIQMIGGQLLVGVWSDGWSRPDKDLRKVLAVVIWGAGETKEAFVVIGVPTGADLNFREKPGLYGLVQDDEVTAFRSAFSGGRSFTVLSRDVGAAEGTEFDILLEGNLRGSGLAMTRLQNCVNALSQRIAADERRDAAVAHIDPDPFRTERPESEPGLTVLLNPEWATSPSAQFPERAQSRGIESGLVALDCLVNPTGALGGCAIVSETPSGAGFGQAALAGARRARVAPSALDQAAEGARAHFSVSFEHQATD